MDRDTAISKIKKCLALARSSEPHEAAAALRQAQKLMAEYGVSDLDVQLADCAEAASKPVAGRKVKAWQAQLAHVVKDAFGCMMLISTGRESRFVFIGLHAAAEVATYAFEVLERQCKKARSAHVAKQPAACKPITKTARGDAFATGWVHGVRANVQPMVNGVEQALLENYLQAYYPNLGKAALSRRDVGRNVRDSSYAEGAIAGRQAQLHAGVGAGEQLRRLA